MPVRRILLTSSSSRITWKLIRRVPPQNISNGGSDGWHAGFEMEIICFRWTIDR